MRVLTYIIIAGIFSGACDILDGTDSPMGSHRQDSPLSCDRGSREKNQPGNLNTPDTVLYVTTMEFEKDYCWQQDAEGENASFNITVYRNGKKYLTVDGGPGKDVSCWPDMSRMLDGHLYLDFCTDYETVISKDGREMFRYSGREMICGFYAKDDIIWTVGQNRSGKGLTFRKNGEIIFENAAGTVIGNISDSSNETGALYRDGEDLIFFFYTLTTVSGRKAYSAYIVRNGSAEQLTLNNNINEIYDMRLIDGAIYIAANIFSSEQYMTIFCGDEATTFDFGGNGCKFSNCRILWSGSDIYVKADWTFNQWKTYGSILWDIKGNCLVKSRAEEWIYDFYARGNDFAFVYPNTERIFFSIFYGNGSSYDVSGYQSSGKYKFISSDCATFAENAFYIGLSPSESGHYPVIIKNLTPEEIPINGFISSVRVAVEYPESD